jgi:hypothetical protein
MKLAPRHGLAALWGAVVLVALSCAGIAGLEPLSFAPPDGSSPDTLTAGDAGQDGGGDAPSACSFVCQGACVAAASPDWGCRADAGCRPCPAPAHTQAACANDACRYQCVTPFLDCNDAGGDGCEVDPGTGDPRNCGACGRVCDAGVCLSGGCASSCGSLTNCDGGCVDTTTSTFACGSCGNQCPARLNATAYCDGGSCGFACSAGFADCDQDPTTGCERGTNSDPTACGPSCKVCTTSGTGYVPTCVNGTCGRGCAPGYTYCSTTRCCDGTFQLCLGGACVACTDVGGDCSSIPCCGNLDCKAARCCKKFSASCASGAECCSGNCNQATFQCAL